MRKLVEYNVSIHCAMQNKALIMSLMSIDISDN